jgi:diketogulonate reductase-like aldo/keto reductase
VGAKVKPSFAQIRTYASRGWEKNTREVCKARGIKFQGFSLLTANREIFEKREFLAIQKKLGCTGAQLVFRFALELGMLPITGTRSSEHMGEDLQSNTLALTTSDKEILEKIAATSN